MSDAFLYLYEVTYKFKDKFEYEYFIEAQTEYSKLRSFCEEFENRMRRWIKYSDYTDFEKIDILEFEQVLSCIRDTYFEMKKEHDE